MDNIKKQVSVSVNTQQKDEEGVSEISTKYDGTMYVKNNVFLIFYTEFDEDGNKTADCRIRCEKGVVEVKREGAYSSRLSFEAGKNFKSVYSTPYGSMPVSVKTKNVLCAMDETGGKIFMHYEMSLAGREFENRVTVRIK